MSPAAPESATAEAWLGTTTRWGQVNFNEQDPTKLDVGWWSAYWRECGLQGILLNVGGPVAYYPTDVPLHRRSSVLGDRDLLGATVAEAKRLGMRVLGRLDPFFVTAEMYRAHPDWCRVRGDGKPVELGTMLLDTEGEMAQAADDANVLYAGCHNSPYFHEYLPEILTEVFSRYDIDGIFTNGWPALLIDPLSPFSLCHCPHCLASWNAAKPGESRPERTDPQDPRWRDLVELTVTEVEVAQRRLREHTQRLRPDATFLSVAFPSPGSQIRWESWIDLVDAVASDAQGRRTLGTHAPRSAALWEVGQQTEILRSVARGKPMLRFTAAYMAGSPLQRHAARPAVETRLIMAEAVAHGEMPIWHTIGGVTHDRRWMPAIREFQNWMRDNEPYLHERSAISVIGVLWSPRSVQLAAWSGAPRPSHQDALGGWYAALAEARLPFEYVHAANLDGLGAYRVVVLPSGLALDDDAIQALSAFKRGGGVLVSCCDALARDAWDGDRDPAAVAALLGIRPAGEARGPLNHSYVELPSDGAVLGDLGDTDVVALGQWVAPFEAPPGAEVEGAWIPDYPTNPTHLVVRPDARRDVPIVAVAQDRSVVHLAADLDASYGRDLLPDHGQVLRQVMAVAIGDAPLPVEVHGGGFIDVRAWRQPGVTTVYLVNLDNPSLHGTMATEVRSQGPLEVVVRTDAEVRDVTLLREGTPCEWSALPGHGATIRVTSVGDFEVVAVRTDATPSTTIEEQR